MPLAHAPLVAALVLAMTPAAVHQTPPGETIAPAARVPAATLLDHYVAGHWNDAGIRALDRHAFDDLVRSVRQTAPAWVRAGGAAELSRRRLAVATYVVDLMWAQDTLTRPTTFQPGPLIEWACDLLRDGPAVPAERDWHLASIGVLERFLADGGEPERGFVAMGNGGFVLDTTMNHLFEHVAHSTRRFPDDPFWRLAKATAIELDTSPSRRGDGIPPTLAQQIESHLTVAASDPALRSEALIRRGAFALRDHRPADALLLLSDAGTPPDAMLAYWLHILQGQAYEDTGRPAAAETAYRRALAIVPGAQTATIALGTRLALDGRRDDAFDLINRMLRRHPAPFDPWPLLASPDARFWPQLRETLRSALVAP